MIIETSLRLNRNIDYFYRIQIKSSKAYPFSMCSKKINMTGKSMSGLLSHFLEILGYVSILGFSLTEKCNFVLDEVNVHSSKVVIFVLMTKECMFYICCSNFVAA